MNEKPLNQEQDILQVLIDYPESLSFVFQLPKEGRNHIYYMKLGDPVFTPKDTLYVSVVPIMGFNQSDGRLWFDELFIPRGKDLLPVTNRNLFDMLTEKVKTIKRFPRDFTTETKTHYKALGLLNEKT